MRKRLAAAALAALLALGLATTALGVGVNDSEVFLSQSFRSSCTLTSTTMMLRRRAILDGDAGWSSITDSAVSRVAWSGGLAWNFTYNGLNVSVLRKSSGWAGSTLDSKREALIALLADHPEGVVAYCASQPHAVLLTDYDADTGLFYCCDPAPYYFQGRVELTRSSLRGGGQDGILQNITQLWYVSGGLSNGAGTMPAPEEATQEAPSWREDAVAWISSQDIDIDGARITFQTYVVVDDAANETCFVDVQALAHVLSGTAGQYDVAVGPDVLLFPGVAYPYDGQGSWEDFPPVVSAAPTDAATQVDGVPQGLDAIQVTDYNGQDHFYYKLRDLGDALGFQVGWDAQRGVFINTQQV